MKRIRDEKPAGPLPKRPAMVRGESSGQGQELTTDDAFLYLKAVKEIFKDKREKYDEFLEVMKHFKAKRLDTAGVIIRVKELFKGHRELILGFNTFLPKGYEITLPAEEELVKKPVEFGQAISYVNKIKTRFLHEEHIYKAFLEILYMYRKGNKSIVDVHDEVASLFRDHQDLLEEFTYFLPDTSGVVAHPAHRVLGGSIPRRDDRGMPWHGPKSSQSDKFIKREKMGTAQHDRDRSSEKHADRQVPDRAAKADKEPHKRERDEIEEKAKDQEEDQSEDEQDSNGVQRPSNKRRCMLKADDVAHKQVKEGEGGLAELPTSAFDEERVPKNLQKKPVFFNKLKMRLGDNDYQEFLKCLNMYTQEIINRADLHKLVEDILGSSKDLMEGFNDFLNHCEGSGMRGLVDGTSSKVKVEKDREKDREERDAERDGDKSGGDHKRDSEKEKDKPSSQASREPLTHKTVIALSKDKYLAKPISELDLSNCERCTPSYRLLPRSYPKPVASNRSAWAHTVLNDKWVSVTSGSEDNSFKHMRKNQYEESLFKCEDDRFELDMLLETTAATIERVDELLRKFQEVANGTHEIKIRVEDHLKAIHMRCIERIYGDHGLDVIDLLRKNIPVALPVILTRLKQKQEEWIKCRTDMNKIWAEVYAKNYHKSLDHRSFHFKEQDKKSLSTKALLEEVKQINEKKRRDDDFILSAAAGNAKAYSSDLTFEYVNKSIYDDLYKIIKYSADEMCSNVEQSHKVMRLWTAFLEPFFGLPARLQVTEDTEDVIKAKHSADIKVNGTHHGEAIPTGRPMEKKYTKQHSSLLADGQMRMSGKHDGAKVARPDLPGPSLGNKTGSNERADTMGQSPYSANGFSHADMAVATERRVHTVPANRKPSEIDTEVDNGGVPMDVPYGRLEREEGELSPSPDVEEQHINRGNGGHLEQGSCFQNNLPDQIVHTRVEEDEDVEYDAEGEGGEPDADADDEGEESGHKGGEGEDSDSVSEAREVASGTESGDGDESPEDREDEDDEDEQLQEKNESESEVEVVVDAHENEGHGAAFRSRNNSFSSCLPVTVHRPSIPVDEAHSEGSMVFYGNDSLYVLFRLHQTLYERILSAKTHARGEQKWKSCKEETSLDAYGRFMRVLYDLLDGSADNAKFEDECRGIIGTQSYVLFTLDKLICKLVKQLQAAASDEMSNKFLALHLYEHCRPPGGFTDAVYRANACVMSHEENLYRFEYTPNSSQLCIQLMESEYTANAMDQKFLRYLGSFLTAGTEREKRSALFLQRNKHHYANPDDCTALMKAMKDAFVVNGLEYKISCKNSKVSYVLDTEDFFIRKERSRKGAASIGVSKLHLWLERVH